MKHNTASPASIHRRRVSTDPQCVDIGRSELYAAEVAAFDGTSFEQLVAFETLERLANSVIAASWWPRGEIALVPARRDASASSTNWKAVGPITIRLARQQFTLATVGHELAHVLAGHECGHGPNFRRAYLDIVGFAFGSEQKAWLAEAFSAHRLAVGTRTWPRPTVTTRDDAIAL